MDTDKIIFAIQDWNEDYNWWHPNTVPLNFVLNGKKRLPATSSWQWFDHGNFNLDREWEKNPELLFKYPALQSDYLSHHPGVKFMLLKNIALSEKYIYPILVRAPGYFEAHENLGFNLVHDRVLKDVKNGIAKIVILFSLEGFSGSKIIGSRDFEILNKWCNDKNLNKNHVYYIHANFKPGDDILKCSFTYIPVCPYLYGFKTKLNAVLPYEPINDKNLFLTYNRRGDKHRLLFMLEIVKNNLFNRGLVSYAGWSSVMLKEYSEMHKLNITLPHRKDLMPSAEKLEEIKTSLRLDYQDLNSNNPVDKITENHHRSTFLFVCTETTYREGTVFFSEKTWKPIIAGQPFLMISSPGAVRELQKLGFKTFNEWWSEDYDSENNIEKRIDKIINIITMLSQLKTEKLIALRKEMEPVLIHNQNLFNTLSKEIVYEGQVYNDEYLHQIVKRVWNDF